jgi:hypothetical protein
LVTFFLQKKKATRRRGGETPIPRPAFSYPLSLPRLCQHSFPLPLPVTTAKIIRSAVSQAKK